MKNIKSFCTSRLSIFTTGGSNRISKRNRQRSQPSEILLRSADFCCHRRIAMVTWSSWCRFWW